MGKQLYFGVKGNWYGEFPRVQTGIIILNYFMVQQSVRHSNTKLNSVTRLGRNVRICSIEAPGVA